MLVGHWPLTESSGDALDYSGRGNDGTVSGATQGASGPMGYDCYDFDGTDDYIIIDSAHVSSYPFSAASWVNLTTTNNGYMFSIADTGFNNDNYQIGVRSGNAAVTSYDTNFEATVGQAVNDGNWHHIAGVWTSSERKLYVDGVFDASDSNGESFVPHGESAIGRVNDSSPSGYLDARIFDVRIYDHALTPEEVQYLYGVSQRASYYSGVKTL